MPRAFGLPLVVLLLLALFAMLALVLTPGCSGYTGYSSARDREAAPPAPPPPPVNTPVRIEGVDGTVMTGELLNGAITIDSGQGPLTLQTRHCYTIDMTEQMDTVDAASINVVGKLRERQFLLKTAHGVFQLEKDRVRRIVVVPDGTAPPAGASATASAVPGSRAGTTGGGSGTRSPATGSYRQAGEPTTTGARRTASYP